MLSQESSLIAEAFEKLGLKIDRIQLNNLKEFLKMMLEWNKKTNLTAITNYSDAVNKHLIDSIMLLKYLNIEGLKIADIGTGAGFPGIPLAIYHENVIIDLIEASKKKCEFLAAVCNKLEFNNVSIIHERAEEVGNNIMHREKYDIVICRAVASMNILAEYALPLLLQGGKFIAYKGPNIDQEIKDSFNAFNILGGRLKDVISFNLSLGGENRTLVVVEKEHPTPGKYPRRIGIPTKRPL